MKGAHFFAVELIFICFFVNDFAVLLCDCEKERTQIEKAKLLCGFR